MEKTWRIWTGISKWQHWSQLNQTKTVNRKANRPWEIAPQMSIVQCLLALLLGPPRRWIRQLQESLKINHWITHSLSHWSLYIWRRWCPLKNQQNSPTVSKIQNRFWFSFYFPPLVFTNKKVVENRIWKQIWTGWSKWWFPWCTVWDSDRLHFIAK